MGEERRDDFDDVIEVHHLRHGSCVSKTPATHAEVVRRALTVRPQVNESFTGSSKSGDGSFAVYMESQQHVYVPRHVPWSSTLPTVPVRERWNVDRTQCLADAATWECSIVLRANQQQVAKDVLRNVEQNRGALLAAPCGMGKCLARGTGVMLCSGECVNVENIKVGDALMGDDSTPRHVLSTCAGNDEMYRVTPEFGEPYTVNAAHILCVIHEDTGEIRDMAIEDYLSLPVGHSWRGYRTSVSFPARAVPSDYQSIIAWWARTPGAGFPRFAVNSTTTRHLMLLTALDALHLLGRLLQMPDGWIRLQLPPTHARDLSFIAQSLGIPVRFAGIAVDMYHPMKTNRLVMTMLMVSPVGEGCYHGFEISGNGRFLLADCTVTHNTVMAVWLMAQLRSKTLVMVHKTFLMAQFKDTLRKFCPNIRVGTIQGKTYDIAGKHVVLGMLQTLCNVHSQIIPELCTEFDLVVVDECHHIAARVFSRAMLRFPSIYTLGLSATPDRKDGLTHVIKWFVGSTVVTPKQREERTCMVQIIQFEHEAHRCGNADCAYGCEKRRKYGTQTVMIPSMISAMVACPQRTHRIAAVIMGVLESQPTRNVLVVTDRVEHARTLLQLVHQHPATRPGLYIGCMKQQDRDRVAQECNVIFGTYALTREGLDIQKLDTLVMATPTGDVVQTAGRIMRARGDNDPLILDIVDDYSVFVNQARKRQKFYRARKYDVEPPRVPPDTDHVEFVDEDM
jgi:superfamily II DNA or RNA helicase